MAPLSWGSLQLLHSETIYGENMEGMPGLITVLTRAPVATFHPVCSKPKRTPQMLSPSLIFRWGNQGDDRAEGAMSHSGWPGGPKSQDTAGSALSTACFSLSSQLRPRQGHGTEQAAPVMPVSECFHSRGGTRHAESVAAKTPTHVSRQLLPLCWHQCTQCIL